MIQARPQQWTHHHTHRLFHMSLGVCFGFIALVMLMGLVAFWWGANAATDPVSHSVGVTATVGGVNPGPIEPGTGSGTQVPPAPANPTVTIVAEPQGQVPQQPLAVGQQTVPAYVFSTPAPAFSGQTSVPNSLVFLNITGSTQFNSTAVADDNGNWFWQSPNLLPPGTYYITATVYDQTDLLRYGQASAYFIVKIGDVPPTDPVGPGLPPVVPGPGGVPEPGGTPGATVPGNQMFGIFVEILEEYKKVYVGNKVIAGITLVNRFSDREVPNQLIQYRVTDLDGSVIMESDDRVSFGRVSRFLKTLLTAPGTKPGLYRLTVESTYQGITSTASDTFVLDSPVPGETGMASGPVILWGALLGLFLLFLLLLIFAYYQVRIVTRHIRDHEDRYHDIKKPLK